MMNDCCPYHEGRHCLFWSEYQLCRFTLQEAEEAAHANWIEIQGLYERIHYLEELLKAAGMDIPLESIGE